MRKYTGTAQEHQKQSYDRHTLAQKYNKGDRVWLHSPAVPRGKSPKFHGPWIGQFVVP